MDLPWSTFEQHHDQMLGLLERTMALPILKDEEFGPGLQYSFWISLQAAANQVHAQAVLIHKRRQREEIHSMAQELGHETDIQTQSQFSQSARIKCSPTPGKLSHTAVKSGLVQQSPEVAGDDQHFQDIPSSSSLADKTAPPCSPCSSTLLLRGTPGHPLISSQPAYGDLSLHGCESRSIKIETCT